MYTERARGQGLEGWYVGQILIYGRQITHLLENLRGTDAEADL